MKRFVNLCVFGWAVQAATLMILAGCQRVNVPPPEPAAPSPAPVIVPVPIPHRPEPPRPEKPRLIIFTIPNCIYCTKLERETLADPRVKAALVSYEVQHVDANKDRELATKYRVTLVPLVVMQSSDGSVRSRVGNLSPPDFIRWLGGTGDLPDTGLSTAIKGE